MASVSQICCYGSLMNNQDLICWFVLLNLNFTLLNTYIFPNMKFSTLFFGSWTWLFKTICGSGQIHVAPHARVMQVTDFHKSLVSFLNQPFIKKCVAWLGRGTTNSWVRFGEGRVKIQQLTCPKKTKKLLLPWWPVHAFSTQNTCYVLWK